MHTAHKTTGQAQVVASCFVTEVLGLTLIPQLVAAINTCTKAILLRLLPRSTTPFKPDTSYTLKGKSLSSLMPNRLRSLTVAKTKLPSIDHMAHPQAMG